MSIKENTIVSTTDRKVTLLQWLKYTNKALENDTLTGVEVRQKGNATFSFVLTFKDGSELESNEFVLAQGESINGATIRNGHLYLSLTNGDELEAGDLKPVTSFAINASQHLIVNYGDGTSQDLGAIFSGNVNIDGNLTGNSIIENMSGYSFTKNESSQFTISYAGVVKNGNKITFAIAGIMNIPAFIERIDLGYFTIPLSVGKKLFPIGNTLFLSYKVVPFYKAYNSKVDVDVNTIKTSDTKIAVATYPKTLEIGIDYSFRYEITFLLSDNLAA